MEGLDHGNNPASNVQHRNKSSGTENSSWRLQWQENHPGGLRNARSGGETGPILDRRSKWGYIVFGQFIAFVATLQNMTSFVLESKLEMVFPMFLMFPAYVMLSLHLITSQRSILPSDESHRVPLTSIRLRVPLLSYIGLSLLDVVPNYLVLLSLKRTSLTSVSLLGSLTIPSTMIACGFLLHAKFTTHHYAGVLLCLSGGIITILGDFTNDGKKDVAESPWVSSFFGDTLAISAAILYGLGDAAAEFWAKHVDRNEYLGMLGLLGSISTLLLFLLFEGGTVYTSFTSPDFPIIAVALMVMYVCFLAVYYMSATLFVVKCDATLLNLSLQSSNLWAALFSIAALREGPPPLFFLAVLMVASGVCIYELCGPVPQKTLPINAASSQSGTEYQSIPLMALQQ